MSFPFLFIVSEKWKINNGFKSKQLIFDLQIFDRDFRFCDTDFFAFKGLSSKIH